MRRCYRCRRARRTRGQWPREPGGGGRPVQRAAVAHQTFDECHRVNCPEKDNKEVVAGREWLGLAQPDVDQRPLRARGTVWGLSGTPILTSEERVIEMASLFGGAYVCGASDHWRKKERASGRDLFLTFQSAEEKSYEHRAFCRDHSKNWIGKACQRNKAPEFNTCGIVTRNISVPMSDATAGRILARVKKNSGGRAHELKPERRSAPGYEN